MYQQKSWKIAAAIMVLFLFSLACGTGYRTTYNISGNSGTIRVRMKESDGTNLTNIEINEDYFRDTIAVAASINVESGTCQAKLAGEDGTSLTLTGSPGNPGQAVGDLITDSFGEINLETTAQQAANVDIQIEFVRR